MSSKTSSTSSPVPLSKAIGQALGGASNSPSTPAVLLPEAPVSQEEIPDAATIKQWRKLAKRGNADAQDKLGAIYANGQGVPKNYAEAVKWFRKAVEQGHDELATLKLVFSHSPVLELACTLRNKLTNIFDEHISKKKANNKIN